MFIFFLMKKKIWDAGVTLKKISDSYTDIFQKNSRFLVISHFFGFFIKILLQLFSAFLKIYHIFFNLLRFS